MIALPIVICDQLGEKRWLGLLTQCADLALVRGDGAEEPPHVKLAEAPKEREPPFLEPGRVTFLPFEEGAPAMEQMLF
ncbi:hypothetical protein [Streptomyces lateritius]|uniref:hypothetical protein n=1 Tax=Streptomyces lateritius TaxID=67313 RepID=UPI001C8B7638|nr:hypothetical protein [Streptomyces lateritius]MBX9426462.1 hypothetical protein [Streptomyces lateritius]